MNNCLRCQLLLSINIRARSNLAFAMVFFDVFRHLASLGANNKIEDNGTKYVANAKANADARCECTLGHEQLVSSHCGDVP